MIQFKAVETGKNILVMVNSYQPTRYLGIMRCAKECGWQVTIESRYAPPGGWHGDGVIVNLLKSPALVRCVRQLRTKGIPVVDLSDSYPELKIPRITEDNVAIGRLAAGHFRERGFIHCGWFSREWTRLHVLRFRGFCEAWNNGTPFRLSLRSVQMLKDMPKPVGIFCFNDYNAQILESECLRMGLHIPEDVAILGVDNNEMICENVSVPLSSISLDFESISYHGARLLANVLDGLCPGTTTQLIAPTGVKVRRSTDILTAEDSNMAKALELIRTNFKHPYGATQLSESLGFSRAKVDRLFANALGRSIGEEILRQRLAFAQNLLRETDHPLESIAKESGFCHASYFVKAFKKATGTTPHVWRRDARSKEKAGGPSTPKQSAAIRPQRLRA